MPERIISVSEYNRVRLWAERNGRLVNSDLPGVFSINGEPLVISGYFQNLVPWRSLLTLKPRIEIRGRGHLICTDAQAQELQREGIMDFSQPTQKGA